jgi:uncharacterized protein YndB with AHSA1/START domain
VRARASVVIDRPVEDVFAFVADFENSPKWQSMVQESERLSPGPTSQGSTFREYAKAMGSKGWVTIEITGYERNRGIAYKSTRFGALAPIAAFSFEPSGDGTKVAFSGDPNPVGPLKPMRGLLSRIASRLWQRNLDSLKQLLEAG